MSNVVSQSVDWPGIRAAAVNLGIRGAARRAAADLPPGEQARFVERVMKRASREGWETARVSALAPPVRTSAAFDVRNVRSGAEIAADEQAALGKRTRLQLSRATEAAAAHAADLTGEAALVSAPLTLSTIKGAAILHGWAQPGSSVGVVNINLLGMSPEAVAVEGRVVEEHVRDLPGTVPEQ